MNKNWRALLCLLLSLMLLCSLCACGDEVEEEEVGPTNPTINPAEYDPEQSYHVYKNGSGTYNFKIVDHAGNAFYSRENEPHQPEFTKLTDSVLQITVPYAANPQQRWAIFCDVRAQKVSTTFGNFLVTKGNKAAYIEHLTDQYHVFVRDIFDGAAQPEVTTLTGLEVDKDGKLYEKAALNKDGALEIVYNTKDGQKTVTVKMP